MSRIPRWMDQGAISQASEGRRPPARVSQPGSGPAARRESAGAPRPETAPGWERASAAMVESLEQAGVSDPGVLAAMRAVPRHRFVEPGLSGRAYEDVALPIGHAQTISRPFTVARMIELLAAGLSREERARARVLEVGTGCGYQAAVLARVFGEVISIERIRGLHELARTNLRTLRLSNLRLVYGDGHEGVPSEAPYDVLIAAAAGDHLPPAWLQQLASGGRLLAPVATASKQSLHLVRRDGRGQWTQQVLDAVRFVPLRDGLA